MDGNLKLKQFQTCIEELTGAKDIPVNLDYNPESDGYWLSFKADDEWMKLELTKKDFEEWDLNKTIKNAVHRLYHARYTTAAHQMQSGVAAMMRYDEKEIQEKALRVGVNSAMVEHSALAQILISRGIITDIEYMRHLALAMESEAESYRERCKFHMGKDVELV